MVDYSVSFTMLREDFTGKCWQECQGIRSTAVLLVAFITHTLVFPLSINMTDMFVL